MRILNLTPSMNPSHGGPPQGIRDSVAAFAALGIENEVACCDAPFAPWLERDSLPIHALGPGKFGFSYTHQLIPWLNKNTDRFDVVILHGMWQWPGLALLRSAIPRFYLMPHGMLDPWFQRDSSRRVKAVRNCFYWWLFERHVVSRAAGVLFTCEEEMRLARTTFGSYYPKKELNVGYGIAPTPDYSEKMRAAFADKLGNLNGRRYLLFLGRIHPKKGIDMLIRAYREILESGKRNADWPDLVIAGPGWESAYGNQMREQIERINSAVHSENFNLRKEKSTHIHAVGMLEGDAKWGALHGCEALILPSHQENFGIVVAEAMACNKPVLITNKVNIWREIAKHKAGVVMNDDFEDIKKTIEDYGTTTFISEQKFSTNPLKCYKECFKTSEYTYRLFNILSGNSCE